MTRILVVAVVAFVLNACAFGGVDKEGAWGMTFGNSKITNCLTETQLDRAQKVTPDGQVIEETEHQISKITENCYTVSGGELSEGGSGVLNTLLFPLRFLGSLLTGGAGAAGG